MLHIYTYQTPLNSSPGHAISNLGYISTICWFLPCGTRLSRSAPILHIHLFIFWKDKINHSNHSKPSHTNRSHSTWNTGRILFTLPFIFIYYFIGILVFILKYYIYFYFLPQLTYNHSNHSKVLWLSHLIIPKPFQPSFQN